MKCETKLNKCKFCESTKTYMTASNISDKFWVRCEGCEATGPKKSTEKQAGEAWND